MWEHLLLCITGLCGGIVIASGTAGLLIGLSIIPRYAGITHTGSHILLYEDSALLGIILGNLACLFPVSIPLGDPFLIIYGFFSATSFIMSNNLFTLCPVKADINTIGAYDKYFNF